jgi:hypothetical protein
MKPPLRIVANALGESANLKDADDRLVACCVESADAKALNDVVNDHDSLAAALRAAREELTDLRRFLGRFHNTTDWHAERKRLARGEKT